MFVFRQHFGFYQHLVFYQQVTALKLHALLAVLLMLASIMLMASAAHADEQDTLNFVAGVSRQYDNNFFKAQSNTQSEQITNIYAGLRFSKQYSLQRFKASGTITNNRYSNNNFLNFTSKNFDAAWLWALTPRLTGTLSADRSESLNDFNDFRNFGVQNIKTSQSQLFLADYAAGGGWHVLGGVSRSSLKNSETFNAVSDFSANSLDVGVKYEFPSQSSVTLMNHTRKGKYDNRGLDATNLLDNGYDEYEQELKLFWAVTAKSQLSLVTSYLKREHDNFSKRDFSGVQGSLTYNWIPTAKISVAVSAQSSLAAFQASDSSYTRTNGFSISPSYALTSNISLQGNVSLSERNFLGDGVLNGSDRVDDIKSASIGVEWRPTRYLGLSASVQTSEQDSNIAGFNFDDTSASVGANLLF